MQPKHPKSVQECSIRFRIVTQKSLEHSQKIETSISRSIGLHFTTPSNSGACVQQPCFDGTQNFVDIHASQDVVVIRHDEFKSSVGDGVTADGMQADETSHRAPLAARHWGEALEYRSAENTPHGALARANVIGREYPPPAGAGAPSGAPRTKSFLRRGRASSGPAVQLEAYPALSFEILGRNSSAAADPTSTAGIVVWTELQQVPSHPGSVESCRQGRSASRSIQSTRRKGN